MRSSRLRAVRVPQGATTVRIPRQRGGSNVPPVFVVVSERPSLSSRIARTVGGWAWHHRAVWAPTAYAVLVYVLAAVVHVTAPWMVFVLSLATPIPLLAWWWTKTKHPERTGEYPGRLLTAAVLTALATAWAAAAVRYGPLVSAVAGAWAVLALVVQVFWLVVRRSK
ncbi:hypothetical protein [Streptomyces sp. SHP 1-2]|uniref:hypothetical protein n=1 Tax=Streptomyces sp. SHP 1-2 TaxID=2769489 RepID=UPI002238C13B|nr:hypothetical protein [Streptomyces sp. SHP 1-2]MCW5254283.1 hypothetical protein [Streptomyces sp. SHP 1-2]